MRTITIGTSGVSHACLVAVLTVIAGRAMAQPIELSATCRGRMLLPRGAVFGAVLEGVSRGDTAAEMVARTGVVPPGNSPVAFTRDGLKRATRLSMAGDRLELLDAAGTRFAAFLAGTQPLPSSASKELTGTSWQLVKFQGGDDTTLVPDDRAKYMIEFAAGGRLTARIDCNRGRGTWTSSGPSQIAFGPLALTRAQCPPGSLHDQIVKQWGYVRSYVIRDGHLFLALMADGGIYEFEPVARPK